MSARTTPHRRRILAGALGVGVLVVGLGLVLALWGLDRTDSAAVAEAFAEQYAAGDPAVCELATPEFERELDRNGRCDDRGQLDSRVRLLFDNPCGSESLAGAEFTPPAAVGKPYALLGLDRFDNEWAVDAITPLDDRRAINPAVCDDDSFEGFNR